VSRVAGVEPLYGCRSRRLTKKIRFEYRVTGCNALPEIRIGKAASRVAASEAPNARVAMASSNIEYLVTSSDLVARVFSSSGSQVSMLLACLPQWQCPAAG